jgi:hypothetical protein
MVAVGCGFFFFLFVTLILSAYIAAQGAIRTTRDRCTKMQATMRNNFVDCWEAQSVFPLKHENQRRREREGGVAEREKEKKIVVLLRSVVKRIVDGEKSRA